VKPPPPVPRPVLEHVFGIDFPDIVEGFVYGSLQSDGLKSRGIWKCGWNLLLSISD